jgi:NADH-quinone oxidoreductase subunit J
MNSIPAADLLLTVIFLFCLATLAAGALLAVFSARLIRSVCGLAICSVGLGGLYYFLHSPFLALMEILIYVGAVCVTIVFAIMLAEPEEPASQASRGATLLWGGAALGVALAIFGAVAWLGTQHSWDAPGTRVSDGSIATIGVALLGTYSLAFELISLALLVAILGALALARTGRSLSTPSGFPTKGTSQSPMIVPSPAAPLAQIDREPLGDLVGHPAALSTPRFEQGNGAATPIAFSKPREESRAL